MQLHLQQLYMEPTIRDVCVKVLNRQKKIMKSKSCGLCQLYSILPDLQTIFGHLREYFHEYFALSIKNKCPGLVPRKYHRENPYNADTAKA